MPTFEYQTGENIYNSSSVTGDVYSGIIRPRSRAGFALTYEFNATGDLVAALYLQCRNHADEDFRNCNNSEFPSSPAGVAGNDEYAVVDTLHAEYRVFVDFTSGDGELAIYINHGQ